MVLCFLSFRDDDTGVGGGRGRRWAKVGCLAPPSKTHARKMRGGCLRVSQGPSRSQELWNRRPEAAATGRRDGNGGQKGNRGRLTCDSVGGFSSSLSGAAPREAPGRWSPVPMPRRLAKFSSRFALRISTCCSSRRRRSSSGLNVFLALNWVRRCSGMYRSAMVATGGGCNDACVALVRGRMTRRWRQEVDGAEETGGRTKPSTCRNSKTGRGCLFVDERCNNKSRVGCCRGGRGRILGGLGWTKVTWAFKSRLPGCGVEWSG